MNRKLLAFLVSVCLTAGVKAQEPPTQEINRLLAMAWKENNLRPSERTTDAQLIGRVSVDILGYVPSAAEIREFQNDVNPDKRSRMVARLLKDEAYATHWAYLWTDWLLPTSYNAVYRGQIQGGSGEPGALAPGGSRSPGADGRSPGADAPGSPVRKRPSTSQMTAVVSALPDSSRAPSGAKSRALILPRCPANWPSSWPVAVATTWIVPAGVPTARSEPSA